MVHVKQRKTQRKTSKRVVTSRATHKCMSEQMYTSEYRRDTEGWTIVWGTSVCVTDKITNHKLVVDNDTIVYGRLSTMDNNSIVPQSFPYFNLIVYLIIKTSTSLTPSLFEWVIGLRCTD